MDYTKLMFPKPELKKAEKKRKRMNARQFQEEQRTRVIDRSEGQCEVWELGVRCGFPSSEVHHLIGGIGRRNLGESALEKNLVAICIEHHRDVHNGRGVVKSLDNDSSGRSTDHTWSGLAPRIIFVRRGQ